MLQIDHVYEFFNASLFKDFELISFFRGVPPPQDNFVLNIFTPSKFNKNIIFYDQEPLLPGYTDSVLDRIMPVLHEDAPTTVLATSEHSDYKQQLLAQYGFEDFYYFFHGWAALDWYRGYRALNYNRRPVGNYTHDFISYNRIIAGDRAYRIYFVSLLKDMGLLNQGLVSFAVTDDSDVLWQDVVADGNSRLSESARRHIEYNLSNVAKLTIDGASIPGSASANIPRSISSEMNPELNTHVNPDAYWHVVTETAFYEPKLHLTEKIFKPIVSKQPFMLLAAPGNLRYLKSYGFKTFDSVIDESYDDIADPDLRVQAVVQQLAWYCGLPKERKHQIQLELEYIVEHNFKHFYQTFPGILATELLTNAQTLFKKMDYTMSVVPSELRQALL